MLVLSNLAYSEDVLKIEMQIEPLQKEAVPLVNITIPNDHQLDGAQLKADADEADIAVGEAVIAFPVDVDNHTLAPTKVEETHLAFPVYTLDSSLTTENESIVKFSGGVSHQTMSFSTLSEDATKELSFNEMVMNQVLEHFGSDLKVSELTNLDEGKLKVEANSIVQIGEGGSYGINSVEDFLMENRNVFSLVKTGDIRLVKIETFQNDEKKYTFNKHVGGFQVVNSDISVVVDNVGNVKEIIFYPTQKSEFSYSSNSSISSKNTVIDKIDYLIRAAYSTSDSNINSIDYKTNKYIDGGNGTKFWEIISVVDESGYKGRCHYRVRVDAISLEYISKEVLVYGNESPNCTLNMLGE